MRTFKNFLRRGTMFAWGGPIVLSIVWMFLKQAGVITELTVDEVVLGILSTTIMAFIVAGVSVVYQIESLPRPVAGLIQGAVIYVVYLLFYLLNGCLPAEKIGFFTAICVIVFVVSWLSVYIPVRIAVSRINKQLGN